MSVTDFQGYLIKYKKGLAVFVALSILLCSFYININQTYSAEIYIKYIGENAPFGMTENGKKLDPYEVLNSLVVKRALEEINESANSISAIRKGITVTPIVLNSEEAKYASYIDSFSSYENTEENRSHPIFYSVKFTTARGTRFARDFLEALVEQYRIYYVENYANSEDITLINDKAVLEYDYYETAEVIENKLRSNVSTLNNMASSDVDFRSAVTGYSLRDLAAEYQFLLETKLADVSRNILENGISRDIELLNTTFKHKADNAVLESNRNTEKASTQKTLMDSYSVKNEDYIWDNTLSDVDDDSNQVRADVERDRIYNTDKSVYDQMTLSYVDYSVKASNLMIDNSIYLRNMEYFSGTSRQDKNIESELQAVCDEYNRIQELTEITMNDYNNYRSARYIANVSGTATIENMGELVYYATAVVLSLCLGIVVVVFLELKRKKKI